MTGPSNSNQPEAFDPATFQPERYGDYELIRPLASGGMAEIFLARKIGVRGFTKLVVVKRIRREMVNQNMVGMFLDEAHVAAKLDHPHIVAISDLGEAEGTYFIAMEYLRGQTLRQLHTRLLERSKMLPAQLWVHLLDQSLDGLHYAHELRNDAGQLVGLVHRDFTPSNIMITYTGNVKLIDFGVAHVTEPTNHQTMVGAIKGKIAYLSPEQCLGKPVDRRTDIFAAGAVLWEMLSGRQLFTGPTDPAIIVSVIQGEIPSPGMPGFPVDPELEAIIRKCLDRDLGRRYQTVAELREDLRRFLRRVEKVDTSDVSAIMAEMFADERASDEKALREMSNSGPISSSGTGSVSRSQSSSVAKAAQEAAAPPRSNNRMVGILVGMAAVFALSAAAWRFWLSKPEPPPKIAIVPASGTTQANNPPPNTQANNPPPNTQANNPPPNTQANNPPPNTQANNNPPPNTQANNPPPNTQANNPPPNTQANNNPPPNTQANNPPGDGKSTAPGTSSSHTTGGYGTIDFDTRPYTSVYLGHKKLGDTPMLDVRVPAGTLTLTLTNDEAGIHETYTLTVPRDGHVVKKLKF
jgi:eukaryotic-like serine/threonine-protein kinase